MRHIHADHMIAAANDTTIEWERLACNADGSFAWVYTLPKWLQDSKYRQKPTPHPHQAMIDQAKADRSIEWQLKRRGSDWQACDPWRLGDSWDKDTEYRQKPKMVDMYQWAVRYDSCSPIYAGDNFYENEIDVKNDRPGFEIICRIEGSKISVEVSQ
jgi:hypothetical protein